MSEDELTEEDVIRYLEECNESQDILGFCYIPEMVCSKILDLYQKEKVLSENHKIAFEKQTENLHELEDIYQKEKQTSHFLQSELDQANAKLIEEKYNKEYSRKEYNEGYFQGRRDERDETDNKIREKIEDYTEKAKMPLVNSQSIREYTFGIRALQELLEERN